MSIGIASIGLALPENKVPTVEIAEKVGLPKKTYDRLECYEIWQAGPEEDPTTLGVRAAWNALEEAEIPPENIDLIIANCWNAEYHMWQFSGKIQDEIQAIHATTLDLYGGCNALGSMIHIAYDQLRADESINCVLLVCSEQLSGGTFPQFIGDGACAIVLKRGANQLILKEFVQITEKLPELGLLEKGGTKQPFQLDSEFKGSIWENVEFNMDKFKKEIKPFIYSMTSKALINACERYGCSVEDLTKIFMVHQQKYFSVELMKYLGLPPDRTPAHYIEKAGHFGGHDVLITLKWAIEDGLIKKGDLLGFIIFGQMEFYGFIIEY
ncbi:3-oxoacyl-[acyl-carrier-protein] synthase III C-terminal domain-containing protein [Sporosarcina limicola]|uniref:3-oxoacyl-[acyl-carrier-protein] synthase III n=1 Tax=Sporosarcina limicola TaxID=34101 RepID=A0A927MN88_9BACL|nr:3-oxoacyl-[acyl-carrier-protein] synthase III C-terminal domain-containing protein [Sporosarcina limicola]MBE1557068.1 3-oxoacyl-[acyl-carrier-protein] synthase III [Sporosarcina limicola]